MSVVVYSLIWEQLTGVEHLLFYGRLKNLKGAELNNVEYLICTLEFRWRKRA